MIGFYNFRTPGLIIRDPELIKTVMLTKFNNFNKNTSSLDPHLDPLLTNDPFFTSGLKWKTNRAILMNALSGSRLKLIAIQLQTVCEKFSSYIEEQTSMSDGDFSVNIQQLMSRFTAELVAIAAFGIDGKSFTNESETFALTVKSMFPPVGVGEIIGINTIFLPFLAKILRIRFMPKNVDNYFRQIINCVLQHREDTGEIAQDFLQKVVDLCKNENDNKVNKNAVTSHAASFFLNGYETSSLTLSFVTYRIATDPIVQTKLRKEIMDNFEKYEGKLTYEFIQEMKYMDQVIKESMRLTPTIPYLAKICTKEFKLVGSDGLECTVYPGTEIIISTIGLHRDPTFWENPDVFDPERFSDDKRRNYHKFIYLPFGSGPKSCVGMRIAIMQMKAALATLLKNYSIEVDEKTKEPVGIHRLSGFTATPSNEIWLRIKSIK
ncbi:hypothetical protein PV327_004323 [Microctonus hyperodae]|uniref:Cytochrome P450 n=1 Tax=Microctonus hyperodae TaxID=165561 RepID=A0AA39FCB2_MICHY|nr:hypothetical protein PV327_004323 [Microctonus hyperodae]